MKHIVKKYIMHSDATALTDATNFLDTGVTVSNDTRLHIYMYFKNETNENMLKTFSIYQAEDRSVICDIHPLPCTLRTIPVDNSYLYSLYCENSSPTGQKFRISTSVDLCYSSYLELNLPPVRVLSSDLCYMPTQGIYMYSKRRTEMFMYQTRTTSTNNFDFEQIRRGIYLHKRELNNWFLVPALKKQMEESCMTVLDDQLYVIGGTDAHGQRLVGYAQVHDSHTDAWR